jgi:excisionase family DNA binding protein
MAPTLRAVTDPPGPSNEVTQDHLNGRSDAAELVLTVEEAAHRLRIGRTLMYSLVSSGEVESVTIGRLRRVPGGALDDYVARLRAAGRAA